MNKKKELKKELKALKKEVKELKKQLKGLAKGGAVAKKAKHSGADPDEAVAAVIALALSQENLFDLHDDDSMILSVKKLIPGTSSWALKSRNMRSVPTLIQG